MSLQAKVMPRLVADVPTMFMKAILLTFTAVVCDFSLSTRQFASHRTARMYQLERLSPGSCRVGGCRSSIDR